MITTIYRNTSLSSPSLFVILLSRNSFAGLHRFLTTMVAVMLRSNNCLGTMHVGLIRDAL